MPGQGREGRIIKANQHRDGAGPLELVRPPSYEWVRVGNLDYNIYLDATHRTVWGTREGPTQVYIDNKPPNNTPVVVPAFGRIFGRQDVEAGPYVDDVPVRILF